MVIPFESLEARVHRLDTLRRRTYLDNVRARHEDWAAGKIPLETLSRDAGDAFEAYAAEGFDAILRGNPSEEPPACLVESYYEGIAALGAAIRDAVLDASARHTVAQVLQERLLRAEIRLRQLMASRSAAKRAGNTLGRPQTAVS